MYYIAIALLLIIVVIYLCAASRRRSSYRHGGYDYGYSKDEDDQDEPATMEMVNKSVDRGIMRGSPEPDVAKCYWSTDFSQEEVDKYNRLNVNDIVTPLVAAKTNLMQGCFCRCGGDIIGKTVYD